MIMIAFAKALEVIPRQICDNAGLDSTDILNKLRVKHENGEKWYGVDVDGPEGIRNNLDAFVWEPSLVKVNAINSATEAACLILSVDETVRAPQSEAVSAYAVPRVGRLLMHYMFLSKIRDRGLLQARRSELSEAGDVGCQGGEGIASCNGEICRCIDVTHPFLCLRSSERFCCLTPSTSGRHATAISSGRAA